MAISTERKQRWESRVQTVMQAIATAAIIWALSIVFTTKDDVSTMKPKIENIQVQMSGMYRAKDAEKDQEAIRVITSANQDHLKRLDTRLDNVDERVRALESSR